MSDFKGERIELFNDKSLRVELMKIAVAEAG